MLTGITGLIEAKGKHPPKIVDTAGGTRLMTKEYFCRNTLRDLRAKTEGLAIPLRKYSGPVPSKMPTPIAPPVKPDPLYLHPCPPGSRAVKIDVKSTAQTIQNAVRPKQSPPSGLPDGKKNRTLTKPVASGSVTPSPSPAPPFTLPSVKVLSHGKEVTLKVVSGENDPSKKTLLKKGLTTRFGIGKQVALTLVKQQNQKKPFGNIGMIRKDANQKHRIIQESP